MNINRLLESALRPIRSRINAMIGKALVNAVNNTGEIQLIKIQAMEGDVIDDVERVEDYGQTSYPPKDDCEVVYACVAGNRDDVLALKVGHSIGRPKDLAEGDVCTWDIHGNRIWMQKGKIALNGDDKSLVTHAELNVALQSMLAMLNTHTHVVATVPTPTTPAPTTTPLPQATLDISAAETTTIKTGG